MGLCIYSPYKSSRFLHYNRSDDYDGHTLSLYEIQSELSVSCNRIRSRTSKTNQKSVIVVRPHGPGFFSEAPTPENLEHASVAAPLVDVQGVSANLN